MPLTSSAEGQLVEETWQPVLKKKVLKSCGAGDQLGIIPALLFFNCFFKQSFKGHGISIPGVLFLATMCRILHKIRRIRAY